MLRRQSTRRGPGNASQAGARSRGSGGSPRDPDFVLYVEGARDREILACWARRSEPSLARLIEKSCVILGGRRPARAMSDFARRGGAAAGWRGLIVLDRDDHLLEGPAQEAESGSSVALGVENGDGVADSADPVAVEGLETFVWSLRHIESYLLVPAAIRRLVDLSDEDQRLERLIDDEIARGRVASGSDGRPASDGVHAKRILGARGLLTELLGRELRAGEIARAMRGEDLHDDVRKLLGRIGALSGMAETGPEVVIRAPRVSR